MSKFHFQIEKLKEILLSKGYSSKFIDKYIPKFMNQFYIKKPVMLTVPKKQLYLVIYIHISRENFKVKTNYLPHDPFISFRAVGNLSHCQE